MLSSVAREGEGSASGGDERLQQRGRPARAEDGSLLAVVREIMF